MGFPMTDILELAKRRSALNAAEALAQGPREKRYWTKVAAALAQERRNDGYC